MMCKKINRVFTNIKQIEFGVVLLTKPNGAGCEFVGAILMKLLIRSFMLNINFNRIKCNID